jgi:hypothetical protein
MHKTVIRRCQDGKRTFLIFEVLTAVKIEVFWILTPCSLVSGSNVLEECIASIVRVEISQDETATPKDVCSQNGSLKHKNELSTRWNSLTLPSSERLKTVTASLNGILVKTETTSKLTLISSLTHLNPEDGGHVLLRNVGSHVQDYADSYIRRLQ